MRPDWQLVLSDFYSYGFVDCFCGHHLEEISTIRQHWDSGHFNYSEARHDDARRLEEDQTLRPARVRFA